MGQPIYPMEARQARHRQTTAKDQVALRGHLSPGEQGGAPAGPSARQEARHSPGLEPPYNEEDKHASSRGKLVEDLGAKTKGAPPVTSPWAWSVGLSGSVHPAFPKDGRPHLTTEDTWTRGGHVASIRPPTGFPA